MKWNLFYCLFISTGFSHGFYVSTNCKFLVNSNFMGCSDLNALPEGSFVDIEIINFSKNKLTDLKPYVFYNRGFYNVRTAILRSNNIVYIYPNAFSMMTNLTHLDLHGNNLTFLHKNAFADLASLRQLRLGGNRIFYFDDEILKPLRALDILDLADNRLTKLEQKLLRHSHVSDLDLSGNPVDFSKEGGILHSRFLTKLSLQSCGLKKLPGDAFSRLPQLEVLDLSRNSLKVIPEGLFSHLIKLEYLDISQNLITAILPGMFLVNSNLQIVYCNNNPAKVNCIELISRGSHESSRKIGLNPGEMILKKGTTSQDQTMDFQLLLFRALLIAAMVFTVFLTVLVSLACYLVRRNRASGEHVYAEIRDA